MLITDLIDKRVESGEVSDAQILELSYGIRYFDLYGKYNTPENFNYWCKTQRELICRLDKLEAAKYKPKKVASKVTLSTQLWEECKCCGNQPIYAETDLCEDCSSK